MCLCATINSAGIRTRTIATCVWPIETTETSSLLSNFAKVTMAFWLHGFRYISMAIFWQLKNCCHAKFWQISKKKKGSKIEKTGKLHGFWPVLTIFSWHGNVALFFFVWQGNQKFSCGNPVSNGDFPATAVCCWVTKLIERRRWYFSCLILFVLIFDGINTWNVIFKY